MEERSHRASEEIIGQGLRGMPGSSLCMKKLTFSFGILPPSTQIFHVGFSPMWEKHHTSWCCGTHLRWITPSVCLGACCGFFLCLDELSGSVLQPSESKSNVTPFTVLAYVLRTIQPYAHLLYVQRLIPHQVCCRFEGFVLLALLAIAAVILLSWHVPFSLLCWNFLTLALLVIGQGLQEPSTAVRKLCKHSLTPQEEWLELLKHCLP